MKERINQLKNKIEDFKQSILDDGDAKDFETIRNMEDSLKKLTKIGFIILILGF